MKRKQVWEQNEDVEGEGTGLSRVKKEKKPTGYKEGKIPK